MYVCIFSIGPILAMCGKNQKKKREKFGFQIMRSCFSEFWFAQPCVQDTIYSAKCGSSCLINLTKKLHIAYGGILSIYGARFLFYRKLFYRPIPVHRKHCGASLCLRFFFSASTLIDSRMVFFSKVINSILPTSPLGMNSACPPWSIRPYFFKNLFSIMFYLLISTGSRGSTNGRCILAGWPSACPSIRTSCSMTSEYNFWKRM